MRRWQDQPVGRGLWRLAEPTEDHALIVACARPPGGVVCPHSALRVRGIRKTRFEGVRARIAAPAQTALDCFRFERRLGPEVAIAVLSGTLRQDMVSVAELSRAEEVLRSRRLRAAFDAGSV